MLVLGDGLLLASAGGPLRVAGALALLRLPGLAWTERLLPTTNRLTRWAVGAGLSYTLAMTLGLILHYLPGPIPFWAELATLNALALVPWLGARGWLPQLPGPRGGAREGREGLGARGWRLVASRWPLILLLAVAAIFRFVNLGYSEFQGDEALAMITAAEALEGHQDALFLRGKGPGEVLLPMILWRLTGTINEPIARLPFAIAGLLMVLTTYSLGRRLLNERAGLIAAGLLALNGFMVGFSRIVQYQTLVVWMSALAVLCAWEWRERGRMRWAALTGAFLGAGLLSHYDAILVTPALAYVQISNTKYQISNTKYQISNLLIAASCLLFVAGLFYIPYALDPQAARTGGYLGDRIGDALLKNNLDSFLHFNVFYNSSYYVILTSLLALSFLAWALRSPPGVHGAPGVPSIPGGRYWIPVLAVVAALGLAIWPDALRIAGLDLAVLPFALILLGAFLSSALEPGQRAVVAWLAVPFLGYNFAVALPLTHIYTIVPAWTLLAAYQIANPPGLPSTCPSWLRHAGQGACAPGAGRAGKSQISNQQISNTQYPIPKGHHVSNLLIAACYLLAAALFSGYLYTAYLRHDVEFWQDWPESQPVLYWSPYDQLPPAGFFGFVHRSGWKEVGALYASDVLNGDYGSNEEPDITAWYTRGAPRACDPEPEYHFIADDLVDPWPVDLDVIEASYEAIGRATLTNGKGLTLYQTRPATSDLGHLETGGDLAHAFDRTATPAAFARSARGSYPADANLDGIVQLIGYDVDTRRARPGGRVAVTLYWQAQVPIRDDYHVFVHLEGDEEAGSTPGIWGQADGRPVCWSYPTFDWRPGQIIADQHAITIKPDTPPGGYPILVGMYLPETGARLEVLDEAGEPVANSIELTTVSIR
jgi:4-amino-4-deoxy-L-arabinose transferase-like glycosyltransferase